MQMSSYRFAEFVNETKSKEEISRRMEGKSPKADPHGKFILSSWKKERNTIR